MPKDEKFLPGKVVQYRYHRPTWLEIIGDDPVDKHRVRTRDVSTGRVLNAHRSSLRKPRWECR